MDEPHLQQRAPLHCKSNEVCETVGLRSEAGRTLNTIAFILYIIIYEYKAVCRRRQLLLVLLFGSPLGVCDVRTDAKCARESALQ